METATSIVGKDQVGTAHTATGLLVNYHLDIVDIDQTLVGNYFTVVMLVDLGQCQVGLDGVLAGFDALREKMGLKTRIQHEDIFTATYQT